MAILIVICIFIHYESCYRHTKITNADEFIGRLNGQDNPVRFIDAFVEQLDLLKLGFEVKTLKNEGRPSFESVTLLRIYLYGYLNGLRSSRRLETECCRNIELQWLTLGLKPNYHTIADFRKDNPKALKTCSNYLFHF